MYDLIIIGAGLGGIALAAEACASRIKQSQILVPGEARDSQLCNSTALFRSGLSCGCSATEDY
jgi:thioredoxin reductase